MVIHTIQSALATVGIKVLNQSTRVVTGFGSVTSLTIDTGDVSDTGSYALNAFLWGDVSGRKSTSED